MKKLLYFSLIFIFYQFDLTRHFLRFRYKVLVYNGVYFPPPGAGAGVVEVVEVVEAVVVVVAVSLCRKEES